ncbi:MAG: hypothetical protein IJO50_03915 [Clostridia bacterium]|nr:hypothetical protein [Clostridia bacterium]
MKKLIKISIAVLLILLVLCGAFAAYARYGWRLRGFSACKDPDTLSVSELTVTDSEVHIEGIVYDSASHFADYHYEMKDGALYIGLHYDLLSDGWAGYDVTIREDFSDLTAIYLSGGGKNKCIWTLEEDKKEMEKIQRVRLYPSVRLTEETNAEAAISGAEFVYADEVLLDRLQHPTFSSLLITKGENYVGVAELENGEELYLSFSENHNVYRIIGRMGAYEY